MSEKYFSILLSVTVITLGLIIIFAKNPFFTPGLFHGDIGISFAKTRWVAGPFFLILGVFFLIKSLKAKPIIRIYFKCSSCGEVSKLEDKPNRLCKKCGTPIEKLEGFFERHPNK